MTKRLLCLLAALPLAACVDAGDAPESQPFTADDVTIVEGAPGPDFLAEWRDEAAPGVAPRCWVVLDWCVSPQSGGPSCSFSNCTVERALSACVSLANSTCGNW